MGVREEAHAAFERAEGVDALPQESAVPVQDMVGAVGSDHAVTTQRVSRFSQEPQIETNGFQGAPAVSRAGRLDFKSLRDEWGERYEESLRQVLAVYVDQATVKQVEAMIGAVGTDAGSLLIIASLAAKARERE